MRYLRFAVISAASLAVLAGCAGFRPSQRAQDFVEHAAYVTVKIALRNDVGVIYGCASAVLIDVDLDPFTHDLVGTFLTARHAVGTDANIEVGFYRPGEDSACYITVASPALKHEFLDAALFTVPGLPEEFAVAATFAASDPVSDSLILSVGYADCGVLSLGLGYIVGRGTNEKGPFILSTARAVPGMSGGAVLNSNGELVGITVAHGFQNRSLHYFLPISALRLWLLGE